MPVVAIAGCSSVIPKRASYRTRFVHRPDARADTDRVVVRAPLVRRGHLPRSPPPSRRRDATTVARHANCPHRTAPHRTLPARPVLHSHAAGRTAPSPPTAMHCRRSVVPQAASDLRRCPGRGASRDLARAGFGDITAPIRSNKTAFPRARALGLCPLPRRMIGQSRAESTVRQGCFNR